MCIHILLLIIPGPKQITWAQPVPRRSGERTPPMNPEMRQLEYWRAPIVPTIVTNMEK